MMPAPYVYHSEAVEKNKQQNQRGQVRHSHKNLLFFYLTLLLYIEVWNRIAIRLSLETYRDPIRIGAKL